MAELIEDTLPGTYAPAEYARFKPDQAFRKAGREVEKERSGGRASQEELDARVALRQKAESII